MGHTKPVALVGMLSAGLKKRACARGPQGRAESALGGLRPWGGSEGAKAILDGSLTRPGAFGFWCFGWGARAQPDGVGGVGKRGNSGRPAGCGWVWAECAWVSAAPGWPMTARAWVEGDPWQRSRGCGEGCARGCEGGGDLPRPAEEVQTPVFTGFLGSSRNRQIVHLACRLLKCAESLCYRLSRVPEHGTFGGKGELGHKAR